MWRSEARCRILCTPSLISNPLAPLRTASVLSIYAHHRDLLIGVLCWGGGRDNYETVVPSQARTDATWRFCIISALNSPRWVRFNGILTAHKYRHNSYLMSATRDIGTRSSKEGHQQWRESRNSQSHVMESLKIRSLAWGHFPKRYIVCSSAYWSLLNETLYFTLMFVHQ